jgi:hypothetical protein
VSMKHMKVFFFVDLSLIRIMMVSNLNSSSNDKYEIKGGVCAKDRVRPAVILLMRAFGFPLSHYYLCHWTKA